ncbi:UDP-2,4-diacetamido-2,4,6-trideoxy-beta-L-altropyranose hydrolase [Thermosynechococcus sp. HY213]|uniref:UDP-2,4-diacetamido-2,4, 6-trideoxy-beta-L-altropyranose hydrolase n=1 Tax=Thermosynechococcus sp. HY213 TaxID=3074104 RepID=UPI00285EE78D|nr:UDP-2,4-diacetamido-2,4,6-trideoxy-beta-L-altropyranose hydrolase [Thermosynechococcus sp. HY213]MDR7920707.1 UDP-2,4-diacetamido-2,4,6-trideoxy-beta-L-altropyranose hydrolase [Thermosynechococcus sp. HY213]
MLIVFRADSATHIGTGHIMRCMTLATALREQGATCIFICRNHPNNIIALVQKKGFRVYELPRGAEPTTAADLGVPQQVDAAQTKQIIESLEATPDWLVVDHYGIDKAWEQQLRPVVKQIFVIDDLANRFHDCDVLLDQNYTHRWDRYVGLVPPHCCQLLGPEYALLRSEFIAAREKLERQGRPPFDPRKVLVFFGGIDPQNYTTRALQILREIGDFAPEVVIGGANPHRAEVESQMQYFPEGQLHIQTDQMPDIMLRCSWYLGSGGSITWERMCLGLTGIVVVTSDNQIEFCEALHADGFDVVIFDISRLEELVKKNLNSSNLDTKLGLKNILITDGKGIKKVVLKMTRLIEQKQLWLRPASQNDLINLFYWANDINVRQNSWNQGFITLNQHNKWFNNKLNSDKVKIYILMYKDIPIGQIRYDFFNEKWLIDYSITSALRGFGIGSKLLELGEKYLLKERGSPLRISAEVKEKNTVSVACFQKSGYAIKQNVIEQSSYFSFEKIITNTEK